jgi:hypothetical protein
MPDSEDDGNQLHGERHQHEQIVQGSPPLYGYPTHIMLVGKLETYLTLIRMAKIIYDLKNFEQIQPKMA